MQRRVGILPAHSVGEFAELGFVEFLCEGFFPSLLYFDIHASKLTLKSETDISKHANLISEKRKVGTMDAFFMKND